MARRRKRGGRTFDGVLLVDKPKGPTSFDVVARIRRALNVSKVGHTGTLDPMATGLLVICIGQGTKLVSYLTGVDKAYQGVAKLGVSTDTFDAEGTPTGSDEPDQVAAVDLAALRAASAAFIGEIEQRPPAFSAIKVNGKRLYELARKGEHVEAPLRSVCVRSLALDGLDEGALTFSAEVSKGTYIRSLAVDLAESVGLRAHLVALRRLSVGRFNVADALSLDAICDDPEAAIAGALDLASAVGELPALHLEGEALEHVRQGRAQIYDVRESGVYRGLEAGVLRALIEVDGAGMGKILRGFPPNG